MKLLKQLYDLYLQTGSVSTDSRKITPNTLFFALKGELFDGNRYACSALTKGAAAVVVDDPGVIPDRATIISKHTLDKERLPLAPGACKTNPSTIPPDQTGSTPPPCGRERALFFLVDDVLETLQELARYHRTQLGIPILAITGSNGKTTTKELVCRVLSQKYRTAVTQGNLNNHIGVPLTLLSMVPGIEFGVVEMGANHCAEIEKLCWIAQPDYGLITNIGHAHLEGFGGPDGVKKGKGELFDYLERSAGVAFYLQQSVALSEMIAERPLLRRVAYSAALCSEVSRSEIVGDLSNTPPLLEVQWSEQVIKTHLVGGYNRENLAAAITIGTYFEVPQEAIISALESYRPDNHRSQQLTTPFNTLILDAYNANPSSMQAALDNFLALSNSEAPLHKAVLLGDMHELGPYTLREHHNVIQRLKESNIAEVYLVGAHFCKAAQGSPFFAFTDTHALRTYWGSAPPRGRLMLIKGSRGVGLESVIDLL